MILLIALVALAILMISGIALVRSFDTSLVVAGNMAFKRDLVNQGERGVAVAIAKLNSGALSNEASRATSNAANNYSATALASSANGIPTMLLDDSLWTMTGADVTDTTNRVTIRYVIDRICTTTGTLAPASCAMYTEGSDAGGTAWLKKAGGAGSGIYRVSVRVTGPRNTQTFIQTTLTL